MGRIAYFLAAVVCLAPSMARAADATAGVDFSTSYIFRGVALNDSFVMQPYLKVVSEGGVTLGTWGNFDLDDNTGGTPEAGEFSEIDLYGSYALPLELDCFNLSIGYIEYTYPHSEAEADREVNVIGSFDTILRPALGVYTGLDGAIEEQVYLEGTVGHDEELATDLTANFGGVVAALFQGEESEADDGFSFAAVSAGLTYKIVTAKVTYYFETDDDVTEVDENVQGTVGLAYAF